MNSNLLNNLTNFIKKRSLEFIGLLIVFFIKKKVKQEKNDTLL